MVNDVALTLADQQTPWARATLGDVSASPGSRNAVPGKLTFTVDLRHPDADALENGRHRTTATANSTSLP